MTDAIPQYRPASITLVRHGQSEANLIDPDSVQDVPKELRGTPKHKVQLTAPGARAGAGYRRGVGGASS